MEETMNTNRTWWIGLGILATLITIGGMGCQAGPRPQGSILDGCAHPTVANQDWCLSMQYPNIK